MAASLRCSETGSLVDGVDDVDDDDDDDDDVGWDERGGEFDNEDEVDDMLCICKTKTSKTMMMWDKAGQEQYDSC
jgi:hypothetical protein